MNAYKMSTENIFHITCSIIDSIEDTAILSLSENELYGHLENDLGYSLSHIRDTFKLATSISLSKYIRRRKYTLVLLQMSHDDFCKLPIQSTVSGIYKFKYKCLQEFPSISSKYLEEFMQPVIDKSLLHDLIQNRLEKEGEAHFFKSMYKDIIKNRLPFEIADDMKHIIIQISSDFLVDLDTTYFTYKNKVFKITAKKDISQFEYEEPFLSLLFEQPVYLCHSTPCLANEAIQQIYQFLSADNKVECCYSIFLEWCDANGWGYKNLISSTTSNESGIIDITLAKNPFIIFNDNNVILDMSFFDRE